MKWLLTVPASTDLGQLAARLSTIGGALLDVPPTPLGDDELVVQADGPNDLRMRVADLGLPVEVYPSSEFDLGG
ncbi:hypothetical protein ACQI4E_28900 [Streptomyces sp. CA-252508]|uniref:hypothetical protein n=1 Tax=Streptomyces sp. CA-252508 TaxID=3418946 RepID=UPI003D8B203D